MGGSFSTYGGEERFIEGFGGGNLQERSLGRLRCRWEDNIKMDFQSRMESMDWIDLAQNGDRWQALADAVMNLQFPYNAGNFLTS
jgi:hypothetical protein